MWNGVNAAQQWRREGWRMRERGWNEKVMRMKYYNMNNDNVAVRLTVSGSVHAKSLPASF